MFQRTARRQTLITRPLHLAQTERRGPGSASARQQLTASAPGSQVCWSAATAEELVRFKEMTEPIVKHAWGFHKSQHEYVKLKSLSVLTDLHQHFNSAGRIC